MNGCNEKLKASIQRVMEAEKIKLEAEVQAAEPHVFSKEFEKKMEEIMRVKGPENPNNKLKTRLLYVMDELDDELEEEMEHAEPHVFSEEFKKKMEKIMEVEEDNPRRCHAVRYVAAVIVTVLLVSSMLLVGNEEVRASKIGVGILKWMENFFVVEEKSQEDNGVLFDESQMGYLPDGFEKVEELKSFSKVLLKYKNNKAEYIVLEVHRDKVEYMIDNEEIKQDVTLNAAGLEYRYIYKEDSKENVVIWQDEDDIYYYLQGTYDKDELIKIMDSISY